MMNGIAPPEASRSKYLIVALGRKCSAPDLMAALGIQEEDLLPMGRTRSNVLFRPLFSEDGQEACMHLRNGGQADAIAAKGHSQDGALYAYYASDRLPIDFYQRRAPPVAPT